MLENINTKRLLIYYKNSSVRDLFFFTKNHSFRNFLKFFNAYRKGKITNLNGIIRYFFMFKKGDEDFAFAVRYLIGLYINPYCLIRGYDVQRRDKLFLYYIKLCPLINKKLKKKYFVLIILKIK
jgi:hypothetical protein